MPIRVEYGPSAVAVGELAFRTGQNEYIAKRRKELEELAQRQAEMRQRGQIQQQNLQADLFKFHGQQQRAMQELQLRQQDFQQRGMQFEQGQQHDVKLAEDRRKHELDLQKVYGERQVADARMRHGLAQERDFNALANQNLVTMFKTNLNEEGQAEGFKLLKEGHDALNDPRIEPTEARRIYQEKVEQANALKDDARYTIDKELQPGYSEGWGAQDGGYESNTPFLRTRKQDGEWEYRQNYSYYEQDQNGEWQERQLTPKEWVEIYQPEPFIVGEQKFIADGFNYETGQWNMVPDQNYDPNAEANAARVEAAENEERINKRLEMYNKYVSGLESPLDAVDFLTWQQKTYGDTIIGGGQQPAPPEQPAAPPVPEAAAAPPQPAPAPAAPEQPAPQPAAQPVEQTPPEQPVQPDQPAGVVTNPAVPPGQPGNPHIAASRAEEEAMRERGEIGEDDIVFIQGEPEEPVDVMQARREHRERITREREEREATEAATHRETLAGMRAAIERGDRKYMAALVPRINAMFSDINRRHPELQTHGVIDDYNVQQLTVLDGEEFERVIKVAEMYWPEVYGEIPTEAKPFVHEPTRREDEAMAEQAEAQRLDAIEAAKREPSIYTPLEQLRQKQDAESLLWNAGISADETLPQPATVSDYDANRFRTAGEEASEQRRHAEDLLQRAGISKEEAEAMDKEYRRQNAAIAAGSPGGPNYQTPMEMGADEPQITGYKLRDGKMEPTMAPGREYMAELERRDAEMRDQAERIDYQPAQEDVSKYGIEQTWETRFGQGPPTMTTHRVSSPAGKGKVEYRIGDQYKVAVYPGAEVADQSTMEGISLQMQYNTSAWQRDPNHRVERVSPEQLMDQTRRKYNPEPKWQGPLQGF